LAGLVVLSCRQENRGLELDAEIEALGAAVVRLPLIEVVPPPDGGQALKDALDRLDQFDWLACTSVNGVAALAGVELPVGLRLAAVGHTTAAAFEEVVHRSALVVPQIPTAADLAAAFPARPGRVLALLAELAGPDLADGLGRRGYDVEVVVAYATARPQHSGAALDEAATADVVLVSSPSVAHRLVEVLGERCPSTAVAIGPKSAAAASELGFTVIQTMPDEVISALGTVDP
jgi:uroporphyrinogen III methyltransferase/synthase